MRDPQTREMSSCGGRLGASSHQAAHDEAVPAEPAIKSAEKRLML